MLALDTNRCYIFCMKLLLTSKGICNKKITDALFELVGKSPAETRIAFVPTAVNVTEGSKDWFVDDLYNIKNLNLKYLDIVDISALPKEVWLPRLEQADVLFFSGGNTYYLMYWFAKSGLEDILPELLSTRVYVGISAGSIAAGLTIEVTGGSKAEYCKRVFDYDSVRALQLVGFHVRPHLDAPNSPHSTTEKVAELAKNIKQVVYALDNQTALKVVDGVVEVVGEGKHLTFNSR